MKFLFNLHIFILFVTYSLQAQQHDMRFEYVSINNGLSQVCVNAILQDRDGYMWFATQDGLNKYDGYSFQIFKPDAHNNKSISNNQIKTIFEDKDGVLWIGTAGGGLCRFNKKTETFKYYLHNPSDKASISSNDVYSIYEDRFGYLWIGTFGGGLNRFDRKTETFKQYIKNPLRPRSLNGASVRTMVEDKKGRLWIGIDGGGIDLYDRKTDDFTHFSNDPKNPNSISRDLVMDIIVDKAGILWIGTYEGGLNRFNPETKKFERFAHIDKDPQSLSNDIVWTLFEYDANTIWLGTRGGGLCVFDKRTKKFTTYKNSPINKYSINDDKILCIYKDKSGLIWLGTENNGLNKYDDKSRKFELYKYDPNNANSISNSNVMGIKQQGNQLLLATRGGCLNSIDLKTGKVTKVKCKPGKNTDFNQLLSLEQAGENKVWLGSEYNGLFLYDLNKGLLKNFRYEFVLNDNQISNNAITSIINMGDSVLWIGTWGGGINKFEIKKNKFTHFTIDRTLMKDVAWCMYKDKNNFLWIGTHGRGLIKFNTKTNEHIYYENERNNPSSISNNVVQSIFESSDGTLWIGTGGGGLNKFNRQKQTFTAYTQKDGLPNDIILGIQEDSKHNLWLSTYNGLCKFSPKTKAVTNYFEENGLQGNSFNERASFKGSDGKLYFGGPKGLTAFYPDSVSENTFIPPVVITDLKIFNKSVGINTLVNDYTILTKPISECDSITLSYKHSVFSFEFAALHFVSPSKNKYKYKMEGFDENWIDADANQRFATYTNLPGGEYTFRVMASNSDGLWNKVGTSIHITIIPPFYKTYWFYSILAVLIIILIYTYIKIREKQLIKEKEHLEDMVRERTQELNQQKEELKLQSELLARSNDEITRSNIMITDSISYAKRIQEAMLPSLDLIKTFLPESFIYFKPKDIVSGDFYWFYEHNNRLYLAVADCTGHGVPGAFMSMIGSTLLNEIVIDKEESVPNEILEKLNIGVIKALNQNSETTGQTQDDGMDITLCCLDFNTNKIEIACANHSAYIIDGEDINLIQGDLLSIGGMFTNVAYRKFTNHVFPLKKGMQLYMFSDGFQDQFGGPKNKKFLASKFKDLLFQNRNIEMQEHTDILDITFETWKGRNRQIDDVLVLGISI